MAKWSTPRKGTGEVTRGRRACKSSNLRRNRCFFPLFFALGLPALSEIKGKMSVVSCPHMSYFPIFQYSSNCSRILNSSLFAILSVYELCPKIYRVIFLKSLKFSFTHSSYRVLHLMSQTSRSSISSLQSVSHSNQNLDILSLSLLSPTLQLRFAAQRIRYVLTTLRNYIDSHT